MLERLRDKGIEELYGDRTCVCASTCGIAAGALDILKELKGKAVGCLGLCSAEPLFYVQEEGKAPIVYTKAGVLGWFYPWEFTPLNVTHPKLKGHENYPRLRDHPFYKKQVRIVLRNCGIIEPLSIEQYVAMGGYYALYKALQMDAEDVIREVKLSGLRGRGGAGFATGIKWEIAREKKGEKLVICNANEGDPGAYVDRSILEGDPFSVIEGMTIGAYAIGAERGFIYVRYEYPLAAEIIENAIELARKKGFLGDNILGTDFSFDISVVRGAGAFICGEETALIESIEGKPGIPRQKPPYPTESGLWNKPTVVNNVETWANVAVIILNGWKFFASLGTEKSKGTKVFSVVGDVKNSGLVEVPMGTKLREIVEDIAMADDAKAVHPGGPTSGCIPSKLFDVEIGYEELAEIGSGIGSGGMIVLSKDTSMVDFARYLSEFSKSESCGKCVPCRLGLAEIHEILNRISSGNCSEADIERIERIAKVVSVASFCDFGKLVPNSILSILKHFRDEFVRG